MTTARNVELAVANHFGYRDNLIVPNVAWGFFHELGYGRQREVDVLVLRPSGWLEEVEIKVSRSDLLADAKKRHGHRHPMIRRTWFAVRRDWADLVPLGFGVMAWWCEKWQGNNAPHLSVVRVAPVNRDAKRATDAQRIQLLRLAAMRIWTLKEKLEAHLHDCHGKTQEATP